MTNKEPDFPFNLDELNPLGGDEVKLEDGTRIV